MRWTTPEIAEISCAMEINMYFPAEDERGGDEGETFASPATDDKGARSAAGR